MALVEALSEVATSSLSSRRKKYLEWMLATTYWEVRARAAVRHVPSSDEMPLQVVQDVVDVVKRHDAQCSHVGDAVRTLKGLGREGELLGRKLSKISIARNVAAHPSRRIVQEVEDLLARGAADGFTKSEPEPEAVKHSTPPMAPERYASDSYSSCPSFFMGDGIDFAVQTVAPTTSEAVNQCDMDRETTVQASVEPPKPVELTAAKKATTESQAADAAAEEAVAKEAVETKVQRRARDYAADEGAPALHGPQQYYLRLDEKAKTKKLVDLLGTLMSDMVVIFVRSVKRAVALNALLEEFKQRVHVTTDMACRMKDAERFDIVISYDFPGASDVYFHRVGRCGRCMVSFVASSTDEEVFKQVDSHFEVTSPGAPMRALLGAMGACDFGRRR
eukprot:TRINITY_DN36473_c0_g1_i1.p1 TRINITY_DN36473_c0_g1~~TRINITY_DN36473_c0_g1_i1.p1  ORF type:complete len:417 (+),score=96.38 TRINITY_DN36473_c0_g1_i1:79-1251(+)